MNVFLVRFMGHYLGGELLIIEETKRKAYNKAKKEIAEMGLQESVEHLSMEDVEIIDTNIKQVIVIDNGDY
jgi:hypothetical protein